MGVSSKFIVDFFAERTSAPICIVSYANLKEEANQFPPAEIYTRDMREVDRFVKKYDKPGRAVYFGVNPVVKGKRRNKQNIAEITTLHTDLDFKTIVESRKEIEAVLARLPLPASLIVFSGNGLHGYWWTSATPAEVERIEAALKRLAWALAGDEKVAEIARVMRLPGSHNTKFGEWAAVEVVAKNGLDPYQLEVLEEWLASIKEPLLHRIGSEEPKSNGHGNVWQQQGARQGAQQRLDIDVMWDELQYLGAGQGGNLHDTQVRIGAALLSRGELVDDVVAYLEAQIISRVPESVDWNWKEELRTMRQQCITWFAKNPDVLQKQIEIKGNLPDWLLRDGRIKALIEIVEGEAPGVKVKEPVLPVLDRLFLEELQQREIVERKWIVDGFILAEQLNGMFGDGGMGKDYLLLQLAIAMTCGGQWLGRDVMQGRVMYFPVEDDLNEVRRREDKITKHLASIGQYRRRLKELMIVPMVGIDAVLGVYDSKSGVVKPTDVFESIKKLVAEFKPDLTIVGNRVNIFSVNQNEDAHAVQCLRLLNTLCVEYQTAVLMPGHVSVRGLESGTGTSGSVQWSNGMRARTFLRRPKDQEDDLNSDLRELQVMKINWGPSDAQIDLTWSNGLFVPTGVTVTRSQPNPGETEEEMRERQRVKEEADAEEACMAMINKALAMGIRLSPQPRAHNYPATLFARDERFSENREYRSNKGYKLLNAAVGRLFMRGKITTRPYGSPSDGTKEIVINKP
jgi:RecA-family ATPase